MQPITIFWNNTVPDPDKQPNPSEVHATDNTLDSANVLIVLEELGLPYRSSFVELEDLDKEPSEEINPTAKLPGIRDPNNDNATVFESGAIVSYLITTYDKSNNLTFGVSSMACLLQQWSYFQASRQAPYVQLATWIKDERLYGEVRRALDILDFHLDRNDWLVGGKCTYADLAFVVWNTRIPLIMNESSEGWDPDDYLGFVFWQKSMMERESVKHALSVMADEEVKSEGKKDLVELLGQVSQ